MDRKQLLVALAASAAACVLARPASARGLVQFHNGSSTQPILVDVRIGDTLNSAVAYGTQRVAKGDTWEVDTSGVLAWWRREVTPGANDGRYTDWKKADVSSSDERVEL